MTVICCYRPVESRETESTETSGSRHSLEQMQSQEFACLHQRLDFYRDPPLPYCQLSLLNPQQIISL
jgi:hypothetical protein